MTTSTFFTSSESKIDYTKILTAGSEYCHSIILNSASCTELSGSENGFIQSDVEEMRGVLREKIMLLSPQYEKDISESAMGSPRVIELTLDIIMKNKLGNCQEFVTLGLSYLLEKHRDTFKEILIIAAGPNQESLNHLYLHLRPGDSSEMLFWDPITKESGNVTIKSGNIFVRGKGERPNRYLSVDLTLGHVTKVIKSINPQIFNFRLPPSVVEAKLLEKPQSSATIKKL